MNDRNGIINYLKYLRDRAVISGSRAVISAITITEPDWIVWLCDKVLELLKEQEPVEPIKTKKEIDFRSEIVDAFCCGNCRHELDHCEKWRYCPNCGKAVKWDDRD